MTVVESIEALRYPYDLVPGDPEFTFPAAEGIHPHCQSDTWFLAGELTGSTSGRRFAFLTIFNQNRPGHSIVADFHTLAVFDLDAGVYGTFTDYDMPPKNMESGTVHKMTAATGCLDIAFDTRAGRSRWTTRRDDGGDPIPFAYDVDLAGIDQRGDRMQLDLDVVASRPPVPVGASTHRGRFQCLAQPETFSYFHSGMSMTGTLTWGGRTEHVAGTAGHVDRQWFPLPAGGGGTGGDPRAISYEWRTIHLDNGADVVAWRQFDRRDANAPRPFTGATVSYADPERAPECVEDIEVRTDGYVRWPESVRQLIRPPAAARYMPDRHVFTSRALDLELSGTPLIAAPAHALPVEYMEGPFAFEGTMRGEPVRGFGIFERSLALHRDWELLDVLATTELAALADTLRPLIAEGRRAEALELLFGESGQLVDDLRSALSVSG